MSSQVGTICDPSNAAIAAQAAARFVEGHECSYDPYMMIFLQGRSLKAQYYSNVVVEMILDATNPRFVAANKDGGIVLEDEEHKPFFQESHEQGSNDKSVSVDKPAVGINSLEGWTRANGQTDPSLSDNLKIWNGIRQVTSLSLLRVDLPIGIDVDEEQNKAPLNQMLHVYEPAEGMEDQGLFVTIDVTQVFYHIRQLYSIPIPTELSALAVSRKMAACIQWSASAVLLMLKRVGYARDSARTKMEALRHYVVSKSIQPLDVFKFDGLIQSLRGLDPPVELSQDECQTIVLQEFVIAVRVLAMAYLNQCDAVEKQQANKARCA